jgi:hypothetical protein
MSIWMRTIHWFYGSPWRTTSTNKSQDWITLRFQDCMSLAAYNSALQRNMSRLRVCGQKTTDADMIHLSTCRYCWDFSQPQKRPWKGKKGEGKRGALFKGKGRPRGKSEPRKVIGETSKQQDNCYRCGGTGHWSHNCRALKHLVELYQSSSRSKNKETQHKSHFIIEPEA